MAVNGGYRIFVHGGFANNAPSSSTWTPADLGGIQEYWYTGAGLAVTSGAAQSWTGQINGTVLTKNTGTGLTYTAADSDVNNKPTIAQNAARNLATLENNNITDFTPTVQRYLGVIGYTGTTSDSAYRMMGMTTTTGGAASEVALFVSAPSNANKSGAYFFGGGAKTGAATADNQLFYSIVDITNASGTTGNLYYNSGTATGVTGITVSDIDPFAIEAGGYDNGAGGFNWDGKLMEMFVCNGNITSDDLTNLSTYVTNTYS